MEFCYIVKRRQILVTNYKKSVSLFLSYLRGPLTLLLLPPAAPFLPCPAFLPRLFLQYFFLYLFTMVLISAFFPPTVLKPGSLFSSSVPPLPPVFCLSAPKMVLDRPGSSTLVSLSVSVAAAVSSPWLAGFVLLSSKFSRE